MQSYVENRDGGYYIAGTRISLDSIVHAFQDGESPEGILRSFPMAGPLVRIYGAITFYLENKEKVEEYRKLRTNVGTQCEGNSRSPTTLWQSGCARLKNKPL